MVWFVMCFHISLEYYSFYSPLIFIVNNLFLFFIVKALDCTNLSLIIFKIHNLKIKIKVEWFIPVQASNKQDYRAPQPVKKKKKKEKIITGCISSSFPAILKKGAGLKRTCDLKTSDLRPQLVVSPFTVIKWGSSIVLSLQPSVSNGARICSRVRWHLRR